MKRSRTGLPRAALTSDWSTSPPS
ncbi:hypothetical protein DSM3645_03293 [Blastopirellula marina DSM 3645]|uniref:Uncharacterized protein n=1 Tax=Blastopirellula marina DSM 3645 TaxID=314230 RepID=A3ZVX2_9BACT|nr:hypothetical protein DSM3645_03293 [Blastopirellula marina DSM 3645]